MLVTLPDCELQFDVDYEEDEEGLLENFDVLKAFAENSYGLEFQRVFIARGTFPNVSIVPLYDAVLDAAREKHEEEKPYRNEYEDEKLTRDQMGIK